MADFSHTRRWWPHELMDEIMPPGRERPQDWLKPDDDGVTTIHWDDDAAEERIACTIEPGSEAVFVWFEYRGEVDVIIKPDGTWSIDDRDTGTPDLFTGKVRPVPPRARIEDANWFALPDDFETMMDSMDGFAECHAQAESIDPDGERVTVKMAYWSEGETFRVSADGKSLEATAHG